MVSPADGEARGPRPASKFNANTLFLSILFIENIKKKIKHVKEIF